MTLPGLADRARATGDITGDDVNFFAGRGDEDQSAVAGKTLNAAGDYARTVFDGHTFATVSKS